MSFIELSELKEKEFFEGVKGKIVHTKNQTIIFWDVKEGALLPLHSHFQEQITTITEGKLELNVDGDVKVLDKDTIATIESNVPHSAKAITDCKLIDVFYPVREDMKV